MATPSNVAISAIAALGNQRQIGKDNKLLWNLPEDLQRFKKLTDSKTVLMGRKTWETLPASVRPLPNRENIILTRDENYKADGAAVLHSLDEALDYARDWSVKNKQEEAFVIGGATIYEQALPYTDKLYLTLVDTDEEGDAFFPKYKDEFTEYTREKNTSGKLTYTFVNLKR